MQPTRVEVFRHPSLGRGLPSLTRAIQVIVGSLRAVAVGVEVYALCTPIVIEHRPS